MGRPKIHADHAARQRAYSARCKANAAARSRSYELNQKAQARIAIERAGLMNNLRTWLRLVDESGLDAAWRQASKTLHPDVGGGCEDFVMLTELTEFMKIELRKKQKGFRVF